MTQEALKLSQEALAGLKDVEKQVRELVDENKALKEALAQTQEPPPWWPAVENILTEYGLQAIDFVADFKQALAQTQEPVAKYSDIVSDGGLDPRNTTPPQRTERPVVCRPRLERVKGNDFEEWRKNISPELYAAGDAVLCWVNEGDLCMPPPQRTEQEPVAHWSDCAVHSEPAYPKGECDCGGFTPQTQEPVAHLWECLGRWSAYLVNNGKQAECAPPQWLCDAVKNATTPPQRTWVGLTDEEKQKIMWVFTQPNGLFKHFKYMEAVEAKLKEKNT